MQVSFFCWGNSFLRISRNGGLCPSSQHFRGMPAALAAGIDGDWNLPLRLLGSEISKATRGSQRELCNLLSVFLWDTVFCRVSEDGVLPIGNENSLCFEDHCGSIREAVFLMASKLLGLSC